jgi:hypothetical protein
MDAHIVTMLFNVLLNDVNEFVSICVQYDVVVSCALNMEDLISNNFCKFGK